MSWRDDRYNAALLRGGWLLSALSIIVGGFVMLGIYEFKEGCGTVLNECVGFSLLGIGVLTLVLYWLVAR